MSAPRDLRYCFSCETDMAAKSVAAATAAPEAETSVAFEDADAAEDESASPPDDAIGTGGWTLSGTGM